MCMPASFVRKRVRVIWSDLNARVYDGALGPVPEVVVTSGIKTVGSCRLSHEGGERTVSKVRVSKARDSIEAVEATARHEIAHAAAWILDGEKGHGATWKAHARRCGAEPTRCHDGSEVSDEVREERVRYVVVCQGCGEETDRQRRSKLVKKPERYQCAACGGDLKVQAGPAHDQETGTDLARAAA